MTVKSDSLRETIGFLAIREHEQHGVFGGYLIINAGGRPVEFHCTAPVRYNRAQEILYGPTLRPFLYGEQIGKTLVEKAKASPLCICIDVPAAICLRARIDCPVLLLSGRAGSELGDGWERSGQLDNPTSLDESISCSLGEKFRVAQAFSDDVNVIDSLLADWVELGFDFEEPFERIEEAILEAHKTARAA